MRVWGLGFGVWGLGFRVWGLGFGFRVSGFLAPAWLEEPLRRDTGATRVGLTGVGGESFDNWLAPTVNITIAAK